MNKQILTAEHTKKPGSLTKILIDKFGHPATVLWRAIEISAIREALDDISLERPILDLGCAEGEIAEFFFRGMAITGLDNCQELLSKNKKTEVYKELFLADGCHMPFKDETFGTVFSNCVIEHIPDLENLLAEVSRVLKPGGQFIFTVPSHKFAESLFFHVFFKTIGLKKSAVWYSKKRNLLLNHYHCYSHEKWRAILQKYSFNLTGYSYYICRKAAMLWDFLAAVFLVLNKLGLGRFAAKITAAKLESFIDKNSSLDKYSGAGLVVIAKKTKGKEA